MLLKFTRTTDINKRFIPFSFFVNDEKQKKSAVLSLPENDKKQKTKDEMNPAKVNNLLE